MKLSSLAVLLLFSTFSFAQLKINEIMTNNVSAVLDDAYNYSMWVELYNSNTSLSYSQSAYYFTDNLAQPKKWNAPYKTIPAKGYSVLWFERNERKGHSSFKLDPEGGKLYLLNSLSVLIDSVLYPPQFRNVSYGRKTDGGDEWVYFEQFSNGTTNNGKVRAATQCEKPVFNKAGGFYSTSIKAGFATTSSTDTIYYTLNGSEPTRRSLRYVPETEISISATTVMRAKTFSFGRLSSPVSGCTYFINERNFKLPVVSIVTDQANLTDNTLGIYVQGTNGLIGNGMDVPANWNQDWDRPVNFELYDTTGVARLNQELDISIAGGWSRMNKQKTLKINPAKKHGNNKLNYDIFAATKPNQKYKSILLRNSGNDFSYSMLRDGYMNSLVMGRMNLDCIAYEPAVCFMNGVYYGIQNLRERSDVDYIYSNYGIEEDDFVLLESAEMATDTNFTKLTNYISANDITQSAVYNKVCAMMDMDSYINYFLTQIYYANTDWPDNNVKVWKLKNGGKWRWILYDTDFGYNLYDTSLYNHNSILYVLGELSSKIPPAWSTVLMRRLALNETFRKKFISRFCIHISSTFESNRSALILDSLANKIKTEIVYHKAKWGSSRDFSSDITNMKTFATYRPLSMLNFISQRFFGSATTQTINLSSNIKGVTYAFNGEEIIDSAISLKYFSNQSIAIKANNVPGYTFKYWEYSNAQNQSNIISYNSSWKYFDGNLVPALNWQTSTYSDAAWKSGISQFGYGSRGESTVISYGADASNKYPTAYFRRVFTVRELAKKENFIVTAFADDAVVIYINGVEVGRNNLPTGAISHSTWALTSNNGITSSFIIPQELLVEGNNTVAVEVHQISGASSDCIFNLQLVCSEKASFQQLTAPVYSAVLTGTTNLKAVYEVANPDDGGNDLNVFINEVVSGNTVVKDEFGDTDDYIEIYNDGKSSVNIAGWYISDTPSNRLLTKIPTNDTLKTIIPAKGRLVLWADDFVLQGTLHLGFKLSKDGEHLSLSRQNYLGNIVVVDSVSVPYLEQNTSYSRVPDGGELWQVKVPTCNQSNGVLVSVSDNYRAFKAYPLPVKNQLTVEGAATKNAKLLDITGKLVYFENMKSDKENLPLGFLQPGIYILIIENTSFKIVKQ